MGQRAERGSKLLLVTRDPRDAAVSHYYHILKSTYRFQGTWDDFCDLFLTGWVEGGDFWDWHDSWDKYFKQASSRQADDCLWVRYEDLIDDLSGQIRRIARFLGLTADSAHHGQLILGDAEFDAIESASQFGAMKELFLRRNALKDACGKKFDPFHIRNGVAGGWSELMSLAQSDAFCVRTAACNAPA